MHLTTRKTHESKAIPGCKFTVRTLNSVQRARRDAAIADHRREYSRVTGELTTLVAKHLGDGSEEERRAKLAALDRSVSAELDLLADQARLIQDEFITPATIRAALFSIEGAGDVTLENFVDEAPDELLDEVKAACEQASGLTADQQKN
jgi:hypothetical protein